MNSLKDGIVKRAFRNEIDKTQKNVQNLIMQKIIKLEKSIAIESDMENIKKLQNQYTDLNQFYDNLHSHDFLLNVTIEELEEIIGDRHVEIQVFSEV